MCAFCSRSSETWTKHVHTFYCNVFLWDFIRSAPVNQPRFSSFWEAGDRPKQNGETEASRWLTVVTKCITPQPKTLIFEIQKNIKWVLHQFLSPAFLFSVRGRFDLSLLTLSVTWDRPLSAAFLLINFLPVFLMRVTEKATKPQLEPVALLLQKHSQSDGSATKTSHWAPEPVRLSDDSDDNKMIRLAERRIVHSCNSRAAMRRKSRHNRGTQTRKGEARQEAQGGAADRGMV